MVVGGGGRVVVKGVVGGTSYGTEPLPRLWDPTPPADARGQGRVEL